MTVHPSFEELADLIFAEAITPEYLRLAARVNAHICSCTACRKTYDVLLSARNRAEALGLAERLQASETEPCSMAQLLERGKMFL